MLRAERLSPRTHRSIHRHLMIDEVKDRDDLIPRHLVRLLRDLEAVRASPVEPVIGIDLVSRDLLFASAPHPRYHSHRLAVTCLIRGAPETDIEVESLYHERLVIVAGADPWTTRRKLRLRERIGEPWIISPFELDASSPLMKACAAEGLQPPENRILSNSLNLRAGLLAGRRFLTLVPGSVLAFQPWQTILKPVRCELPAWEFPTAVFTPKSRTLSAGAEAFLNAIRAKAKQL